MNKWFKVYLKTHEQWPITFFTGADKSSQEIQTIKELKNYLKKHASIHYIKPTAKDRQEKMNIMYKSQILTIVGPILQKETDLVHIYDVMSLSEASHKWGLKTASTLRNAIRNKRFQANEHRKSDGTWLVTKQGMTRLYGPEPDHDYDKLIVNEINYLEKGGKFELTAKL